MKTDFIYRNKSQKIDFNLLFHFLLQGIVHNGNSTNTPPNIGRSVEFQVLVNDLIDGVDGLVSENVSRLSFKVEILQFH